MPAGGHDEVEISHQPLEHDGDRFDAVGGDLGLPYLETEVAQRSDGGGPGPILGEPAAHSIRDGHDGGPHRDQSPDRPPDFANSRTGPITAARSTPLIMS